ncbi:MAG TPA: GxxExxY protein [Fimbriimonadaceae bacterium]|jgi:GxxExxY protein
MAEIGRVAALKMARKLQEEKPENALTGTIIELAIKVHSTLGPGLLESVYETALAHELSMAGLRVRRQVQVPVVYDGIVFEVGFRLDLLVEEEIIVEIKSVESISPTHAKILLTYLRLSNKRVGLIINFSEALLKHGIKRIVNGE